VGIALGSVLTLAISSILKARSSTSKKQTEGPKDSNENENETHRLSITSEMREEQLSRNYLFFNSSEYKGMDDIVSAKVAVVGLGGVGSHAAHMLARAGVGMMRLIDFDQVTLSSLNRHAVATLEDVGIPKVEAMKRFLCRVAGGSHVARIESRVSMYTAEYEDELLSDVKWDFIVDAIDDVKTKAALLAYCVRTKTRVISCMGAGGKSDPTRIHIGDLRSASRDPLATKLKWLLKKLSVDIDSELINIVYSSEKTVVPLAELTDDQKAGSPGEFGAVDNMRVRVLPVLGTMPAMMGQAQAAFALCELGKKPLSPIAGERIGKNVRHRRLQHFKNRETKIRQEAEKLHCNQPENKASKDSEQFHGRLIGNTWVGPVQIDQDDVEYLMSEVWRNRCAATGARLGSVLELVRWDNSKPSVCSNLVLMSVKAVAIFDEKGQDGFNEQIRNKIDTRLASCRIDASA